MPLESITTQETIPQESVANSSPPIDPRDVPSEHGRLHVGDSELRYVGGEHWAAILDKITDLKDQLNREEDDVVSLEPALPSSSASVHEPTNGPPRRALLLYSCPRPTSREEILFVLPPKATVDRYLSRYFTCLELTSCMCQKHLRSLLQPHSLTHLFTRHDSWTYLSPRV